jgi:hypothetical protein
MEHTFKVVAARKTNEDSGKNDHSHAGETEIVERKVLRSNLDWSALVAIVSRKEVNGLFLRQ